MLDQIHRELAYADSHLPRWRYVPEAALRRRGDDEPDLFLADLLEKPARLRALDLDDAWGFVASSRAGGAARHGLLALREPGRRRPAPRRRVPRRGRARRPTCCPPSAPDTLVIAVSASAGSAETLDAVDGSACPSSAVANQPGPLTERATRTVWMQAGEERGGVACRSFQHTLALLLALESTWSVSRFLRSQTPPTPGGPARRADAWRPRLAELLLGPHGTHVVAPARRISSAYQSALMLREGPRLPAVGCETGDWSHVDVYLTKTTDYRMLLLGGSRWEQQLLEWTASAAAPSSPSVPTSPA